MNLQLLEPAIAPHISGTRRWCASRFVRLGIGLFAVWPFATTAFALDPQKAITQFVHAAWTAKEEAPANIAAITQTQDGKLRLDPVRRLGGQHLVGKHPWARPLLGFAYRTT